MIKEMNEKITVIERAQDDMDVQMMKETIDNLNDRFFQAEQNRQEMDNQLKIVNTNLEADRSDSKSRIQKMSKYLKKIIVTNSLIAIIIWLA